MHQQQLRTCWGIILCFLLATTHYAHCGPSYADYENVRDLYDLLLQKQLIQDNLSPMHQITRKSARSPSLRLRFGKKSDPYLSGQPYRLTDDSQEN